MSKKRKLKTFMSVQCPCCLRSTYKEYPFKVKQFKRFNHYEGHLEKRMGLVCYKCGYIISEEGIEVRMDLPVMER